MTRLTADAATLSDGTTALVDCVLRTAAVTAARAVAGWGLPQGRGGRIRVRADLRVIGSDRVFAVGDLAVNQARPNRATVSIEVDADYGTPRCVAR